MSKSSDQADNHSPPSSPSSPQRKTPPAGAIPLADFLRSFLRDELPEVLARVVREEIEALKQEIEESRQQQAEEAQAVLDTRQTCTRLNVSPRKLDQLVAAGYLKPIRIGRKRLFPVTQIDGLLRQAAAGRVR